jgi:hypothetical protein
VSRIYCIVQQNQDIFEKVQRVLKNRTFCSARKAAKKAGIPLRQDTLNIVGMCISQLGWKKWNAGGSRRTWYDPEKWEDESE